MNPTVLRHNIHVTPAPRQPSQENNQKTERATGTARATGRGTSPTTALLYARCSQLQHQAVPTTTHAVESAAAAQSCVLASRHALHDHG